MRLFTLLTLILLLMLTATPAMAQIIKAKTIDSTYACHYLSHAKQFLDYTLDSDHRAMYQMVEDNYCFHFGKRTVYILDVDGILVKIRAEGYHNDYWTPFVFLDD